MLSSYTSERFELVFFPANYKIEPLIRDSYSKDRKSLATSSPVVNYWPDSKCARAFWRQQDLPPYQQLLADTSDWLDPGEGDHWLDLGCGSGQLTRALWVKSRGRLAEVVGIDCAAINAQAFDRLRANLQPTPTTDRIRFVAADFSQGLAGWKSSRYDGIVSGLALHYSESYSAETKSWTSAAYDRVLSEVFRLLKSGGRFVFSVTVPNPSWARVALSSWRGAFRTHNPLRYWRNAWRMMNYGSWLKRQARIGRFHYLPLPILIDKLARAGFADIEHRLSYAGQAYLLRCRKLPPLP
jgi:ubiquinone/menaquinone biosynthesis C-methylase UbiE